MGIERSMLTVVSLLKFDNETKRLVREGVPSEVNPFDVLAMSAAVTLKGATGAEVVAITMGPPDAREALVQCIAMGADGAVHLVDRAFAGADTLATARALGPLPVVLEGHGGASGST